MSPLDDLTTYHVQRAKQRTHRPCRTHGSVRLVCESCAKVICPLCPVHTCVIPVARVEVAITRTYKPPRGLLPVWRIVQPLGALDIQPHPDAEAWLIRFPPQSMQAESAGDLANRLWATPAFVALATTTAFRAGRGSKPTHWWVSFQLKEKIHERTNIRVIGTATAEHGVEDQDSPEDHGDAGPTGLQGNDESRNRGNGS